MDACINSQHFTEALEYAKRLEKPYYKLYPDNYPTTGIHLMKLGKLECYLGNFQQAVNSLGKVGVLILFQNCLYQVFST